MSDASFTFCGVDISSIGLTYVPEMSQTFVFGPSETQSHTEMFESHNGGYYYGSWRKTKEFVLRCLFEESNINDGVMERIYSLFKAGRSGKLVFSKRPWCYYYATVTSPIQTDYVNYLNGLVTITLEAMYPFARSEIITNTRLDKDHENIIQNSAVFENTNMELPNTYNLTHQTSLILANQGTERAALGIAISGNVGSGVIITNNTTQQSCKIVALTKALSTNLNRRVVIDPISGKTILTGGGINELAFKYHEYGFIELESSFPATRNLFVDYVAGYSVNVTNIINKDLTGKYIYVNNAWRKIVNQPNKHQLTVSTRIQGSGKEKTMAMAMNEITVKPITTMDVNIEFIYKPTYA